MTAIAPHLRSEEVDLPGGDQARTRDPASRTTLVRYRSRVLKALRDEAGCRPSRATVQGMVWAERVIRSMPLEDASAASTKATDSDLATAWKLGVEYGQHANGRLVADRATARQAQARFELLLSSASIAARAAEESRLPTAAVGVDEHLVLAILHELTCAAHADNPKGVAKACEKLLTALGISPGATLDKPAP